MEVQGIEVNDNTIIGDRQYVISNGDVYFITSHGGVSKMGKNNVKLYCNKYDGHEFVANKSMYIISQDNKIIINAEPNITRIQEKSNYSMRKVFENAIFVQGKGDNINIVDKNGKVYESTNSKESNKIENAKKIISSSTSKYIIKNDGTLWAKGSNSTGMWGEQADQSDYVQITKDGTQPFTDVKDVYTSTEGRSAIFITEDNKMYWGGSSSYIILPQLKGDYTANTNALCTYYPKEVNSEMLDQIREKIKDIEYSFQNEGGVYGRLTLILTDDGKLYTISDNKNVTGNGIASNITNDDLKELTIKEGTTVKQIITQDGLSLALLSNGEVYGWGYNTYGILGPSYEVGGVYPTPVKLEGLPANIRYMSLGNGFAIFASKSGEVYGIGKNDYGQLGTGDSAGRTEFVRCTRLEE